MYFGQSIGYTDDTFCQHVAGTMELLRRYDGVSFFFSDKPLYPADILVGYNAFLMDFHLPQPDSLNLCFQQAYGYDTFAFLSSEIRGRGLNRKGKNHAQRQLQRLLNGGVSP